MRRLKCGLGIVFILFICIAGAGAVANAETGRVYSLTTIISIDDLAAFTEVGGVELAGFRDDANNEPVLSVRWGMRGGMMPTWTIVLHDHKGLLPKQGQDVEIPLAYTYGYPAAKHVYQTVINYDAYAGELWISVVDTTEGNVLCEKQYTAGSTAIHLTPYAGVDRQVGKVLSQSLSSAWIPAGISWRLGSTAAMGAQDSVVPAAIGRRHLYVDVDMTGRQFAGEFRLRFRPERSAVEHEVPLRRAAGGFTPERADDLPLGACDIVLAYVQDGHTWVLGRSNTKLVDATVTTKVEVRKKTDADIQGVAILTSDTPVDDVAFEMVADIDVWQFNGRWEAVEKGVKVLAGQVSLDRQPVAVAFQMANPAALAAVPGVYRINFRFAGIPADHYHWSATESGVKWSDGKGNSYTDNDYFVRARTYDAAQTATAGQLPPVSVLRQQSAPTTLAELRQRRAEAAKRPRRIIFNNDGNDALGGAASPTPHGMLTPRTHPLTVSQVDAIFYATEGVGLLNTTRRTEVGRTITHRVEPLDNIVPELMAMGTDPLQVMVEFGHKLDIEVFMSMRMNDTHDINTTQFDYLFDYKREHPDYLLGSAEHPTVRGRWTGFDYARPEIREMAFRLAEEACQNYDIDGIELDFFRHLQYFKSVAYDLPVTDAELGMMTELLRRIRHMTEVEGLKRGRPILVAVRVPDSVEYARAVGLDIRTWLAEGLVDLLITSGYFRLNPWEYSVALAREYGVQVYASLDQSRLPDADRRNSIESYRAQALNAWQAGVDGIYMFNIFNTRLPHFQEIGDPQLIAYRDKLYFANERNRGGSGAAVEKPVTYLKDGYGYQHMSRLSEHDPLTITPKRPEVVEIHIGDDLQAAVAKGYRPQAQLHIKCAGRSEDMGVKVNGKVATNGSMAAGWAQYTLELDMLQQGVNQISIGLKENAATDSMIVQDMVVSISYRK